MAERGDVAHGGQRLVSRRAAGAVGDAEEFRRRARQLGDDALQLLAADRRVRWKELEANRNRQARAHGDGTFAARVGAWRKNSRAPSLPGVALSNQSRTTRPFAAHALLQLLLDVAICARVLDLAARPMSTGCSSNCGFTSSSSGPPSSGTIAGRTSASEMNDKSPTTRS